MDRKEFLSTFGYGLAAICAGGCLASCSKSSTDTPGGGTGTTPPAGVNFTVDLNNEIKNIGESITRNGVIVARLATGATASSFTAVQVACTHEGTAVSFSNSQTKFICPNHGSQFTTEGVVLNGPATKNLKKFNIAVASNTMTVTG
ncbi:MAG TPA: Rieske 2Fe-2S domain-containing protein [Segetibacter sp.]|jgi:Rieske Fe-S protein